METLGEICRLRAESLRGQLDGRYPATLAAREAAPDPEEAIRRLIQRKYERRLGDEKGRRQTAAGNSPIPAGSPQWGS